MIKGIFLSSKSLGLKSKNVESVANNLANINTTGYKRQLPFSEVLSQTGEIKVKQYTDFRQGDLAATGNPFDLAISGEGYFALKTEDGTEYTRNGKFILSAEGYLINEQGHKVLGHGGEISFFEFENQENQQIQINSHGEIRVGENIVDSILIVKINTEQDSARLSGLNFAAEELDTSNAESDSFELHQGYLEESNVNPVIEMETMIRMNNDFESAQKMMKYLDQSLGQANEIGKV